MYFRTLKRQKQTTEEEQEKEEQEEGGAVEAFHVHLCAANVARCFSQNTKTNQNGAQRTTTHFYLPPNTFQSA